ncbi:MAG: aldo/keto reductase [Chlorobiales bacterium]
MISKLNLSERLSLSRLSLGVWRMNQWNLNDEALRALFETAVELGISTIDHADIYGDYTCEARFGAIVPTALRQQMQLVTKCGIKLVSPNRPEHQLKTYDTSAAHILRSVETSLKHLKTDYLDALLLHRPNPLMNADEIAEVFSSLRASGKVLEFGVSNFTPSQVSLLQSRLSFKLVTNQIEFSVLHLAPMYDGVLDQAQECSMPPMAWSPLAGGRLFGEGEQAWRVRSELSLVANEVHASLEQVALAWIMKHPSKPMPILGSGKIERLKDMVKADSLALSNEHWFRILRASTGESVP